MEYVYHINANLRHGQEFRITSIKEVHCLVRISHYGSLLFRRSSDLLMLLLLTHQRQMMLRWANLGKSETVVVLLVLFLLESNDELFDLLSSRFCDQRL